MGSIQIEFPQLPYEVEEALNRLRVNVKFCGKNTRKILIDSSVPDEGKSFVSVQLWRMLAEAGLQTVLVDADLRKSGLAEYSDIVYHTNVKNGDIVPCTNLLENPSTLLEDPRMEELLDKLAEDYRYVIVDAPPLVNVADGVQMAHMCDGAILVVNSGETSKTLVKQSLNQLERADCRLLGVILNKAQTATRAYYKYYGKYGSYYYGKDHNSEN